MLTLFSLLSCFLNFQVLEVGYQSLNMNKETAVNQTGQCMFCRTWNQHNCTKLWYVMSLKMFGCFVHSRCGNKLLTPCEVIGILKSGKFLLVEYDILGFRICNLRIWSPALDGIWNVVPRFWNPQCRTVLDYLVWGEMMLMILFTFYRCH